MTSTGHPLGDAVLPAALRLVGAVRTGDPKQITTAIGEAQTAAQNHPQWPTALMLVLAGMVPIGKRPAELLAWTDPWADWSVQTWAERGAGA